MQNLDMQRWNGSEIAVIGMACRFPKSNNLESFWENLRNGVNCISTLTDESLVPSGIDPVDLNHPNYVKAAPILDDVERFDAAFFGITPNEALVMDPQHRLFLECSWSALEDAGYNPGLYEGSIGVFAGARVSSYLFNIYSNPEVVNSIGGFEIGLGNDLGFLSTRTSYKFNLRGPSCSVHTACSTSLVAVHLACQSLLIDECQMALAGGVAVNVPHKAGYLYRPGSIFSPDGHCRAFDEKAQGTVFGSGVGVLVLKRLENALNDGDNIYAVILGSAINNDGSTKASFSAPSVQGQSQVILDALAAAGVGPESVSYIEAHGTGTPIGDPIEIRALTRAFGVRAADKACCAIGSVKSNLGHLDAAAGMASIIKTILALHHRMVPPSIDFHKPNPAMELEGSPFYINTELREWESPAGPRRAGVSSFGVGGTNAHVVLEEAPPRAGKDKPERDWELLLLSARSQSALEQMTRNLGEHLNRHGREAELANVAYTLQVGRKQFPYRRFVLCRDLPQGVEALLGRSDARSCVYSQREERENRPVVFLFPGQGSQYAGMGRELYQEEKVFRGEVDRCAESVREELGLDMREVLLGGAEWSEELQQTWLTQPALFVVEYALARQWMSWGVKPEAMLGHSVGEYVAGCVAGVFSVEEGLRLVVRRARLMQKQRPGKMLAVGLSESKAGEVLGEGVWLGAVNGPMQVVLSGEAEALREKAAKLEEEGVSCRWLETSHAFHSGMMEGMLEEFLEEVKQVNLKDPEVPFISNVSGKWIKGEEARDAGYWARHVREPVRFGEGIRELLQDPQRVFLEVGPRQTLAALARANAISAEVPVVLPSLPGQSSSEKGSAFLGTTLGRLWLAGGGFDSRELFGHRHRVPLPTYPFEGERYWLPSKNETFSATGSHRPAGKNTRIEDWFFFPLWKQSLPAGPAESEPFSGSWIIFSDQSELAETLANLLRQQSATIFRVEAGKDFLRKSEYVFTLNPAERRHYDLLLQELPADSPAQIIHLWSRSEACEEQSGAELFKKLQTCGYYSLLYLSQAAAASAQEVQINVVSDRLFAVETSDALLAEKQPMAALCKVIPQENPGLKFRCMDVDCGKDSMSAVEAAARILEETSAAPEHPLVAYRRNRRFIQVFDPVKMGSSCRRLRALKKHGVYVITGAFGGVGVILSEYLAKTFHARLVLIARSRLPQMEAWSEYLAGHSEEDETSRRIRHIQRLQELGADVMTCYTDVADAVQLNACFDLVQERYGGIDGVFHAAGITAGESLYRSFTELGASESEIQFGPKVHGVYALREALHNRNAGFCMMFSSISAVLGGLGYLAYAAANSFMDAFSAVRHPGTTAWISVNWDPWPEETKKSIVQTGVDQYAMTREESMDALERILNFCVSGQVVVATGDLEERLNIWIGHNSEAPVAHSSRRPDLPTEYAPPSNALEESIAKIWERLLGIEGIGIHDNFFDLGGHSLLATRLISQLRDELNFTVSINEFFVAPTVAAIAELGKSTESAQDEERDAILALLEQLSDEQVEVELKKRALIED